MRKSKSLWLLLLALPGAIQAQAVPPPQRAGTAAGAAQVASAPHSTPNTSPMVLKAPGLAQSVVTVDALLRLENELALQEAVKARAAAGLGGDSPSRAVKAARTEPPPLALTVESISGVGDTLRADVSTREGERFQQLRPGSRIRGCEVERIANRCVVLRPVTQVGRQQPAACPVACWTGVRLPAVATLSPLPGGAPGLHPPLPPGIAPGMGASAQLPAGPR